MIKKIYPKTIGDFVTFNVENGTSICISATQIAVANNKFTKELETIAIDLTLIDNNPRGRGDKSETLMKVKDCQIANQFVEMHLSNGSNIKLSLTEFKTLLSTR